MRFKELKPEYKGLIIGALITLAFWLLVGILSWSDLDTMNFRVIIVILGSLFFGLPIIIVTAINEFLAIPKQLVIPIFILSTLLPLLVGYMYGRFRHKRHSTPILIIFLTLYFIINSVIAYASLNLLYFFNFFI